MGRRSLHQSGRAHAGTDRGQSAHRVDPAILQSACMQDEDVRSVRHCAVAGGLYGHPDAMFGGATNGGGDVCGVGGNDDRSGV